MRWPVAVTLIVVLVAAVVSLSFPSLFSKPGSTPYPLPTGARSVPLRVYSNPLPLGCILEAPHQAILVAWDRSAHLLSFSGGQWRVGSAADLVWPAGFSARELAGRAELVKPDGTVLGRDGDTVDVLGDDPNYVCA